MDIIETQQLLRFFAALVFVIALMGGLALLMRRIGSNHPLTAPHKRRLKIVETLPVDARRRLVLLKRDNKEHLVILGPNSETVIERNIESEKNEDAPHGS